MRQRASIREYHWWAWARGRDCGSTSPRSLDELAQLRHTAHYSPAMNCTFVDQFIACRLQALSAPFFAIKAALGPRWFPALRGLGCAPRVPGSRPVHRRQRRRGSIHHRSEKSCRAWRRKYGRHSPARSQGHAGGRSELYMPPRALVRVMGS
jgi:hypothetical protein